MPLPHPTDLGAATRNPCAPCTIGLVADTHIPDRAKYLHPNLVPLLRDAGVAYILHAGDISLRSVLDELEQTAPVIAVRGNRDVLTGPLPMSAVLKTGPDCTVRIKLVHGHFGLFHYLWDKVHFLRAGYDLKRYLPRLAKEVQDADAIVFGHTHYPLVLNLDGKLLVNPGSASFGPQRSLLPSFGLLRVSADGQVSAEIVPLTGWKIKNREWVPG